jgi:WD40 repeat protein
MAFNLRSSKFRHVFANEPTKIGTFWDGVKLTKNAWDSNYSTASSKWIAMAWESGGGGSIGILDANKPGKLEPTKVPLLTGHKGAVLDLDFSPFNDDILATCSEDTTIKIWNIKGGFDGHKSTWDQELKGHTKKVGSIKWHPVAENLIISTGTDYNVRVWDVETGQSKLKIDGQHTAIIQSCEWNYDGSLAVTNAKDKFVRIVDPRQQTIVGQAESHVGVKGGRALYLGKHNLILSVGFGTGASREYKVYDPRKFEQAICTQNLDSAAGVIMPFYDEDSDVLFMAGKGDGAIRYYEILPNEEPKAICQHLGQFSSNSPTAAACAIPRRSCDVSQTEIIRIYKIAKGQIMPLHFQVPRKSELFAEDIYPPARGDEPNIKKEAWLSGENATPKLVSLEGGFVTKEKADTGFKSAPVEASATPTDLKAAYEELKKRVATLEAELEKRDARISELESK